MPYSKILLNTEELSRIVSRLAHEISSACCDRDNCLALVVLEGAKYFAEDLLAKLDFPVQVEYIKASSYSGVHSTGNVVVDINDSIEEKIRGKNILLIDDIYDTGLTLSRIRDWLNGCGAKSIQTCVLLEKQHKHTKEVNVDFIGTRIEDTFIVGYGLDYNGQYRDLPFVGILSEELIQ